MPPALSDLLASLADASVPFALPPASLVAGLSDEELMAAQRRVAEVRRRSDAVQATLVAEAAHRSRRELGHAGLAARHGAGSVEKFVQHLTGASAPEAKTLVEAGALLPVDQPRADAAPQPSWLVAVGEALAAGRLSAFAAAAIKAGLGAESDAVSAGDLAIAAARLLGEASGLTVEQVGARARELRDELDLAGVRDREAAQFEKRYLRFTKLPDGMTRVHGLLDTESAGILMPIVDRLTSPRRNGPRFTHPDDIARADELLRDPRSTEQLTLDGVVDLIRCGVAADSSKIIGSRKPRVNVLVTQKDLDRRDGIAFFAGQSEAVSVQTAERQICATGLLPILFDNTGQPMKLGREQRLFSEAQRIAIAARDGGCIFGDCTAPASWTEAHHIDEWDRDHGLTNVEDGVCLCRFHHLLLHNRGWRITRKAGRYYLTPPPTEDPEQKPILLRQKSRALTRMRADA